MSSESRKRAEADARRARKALTFGERHSPTGLIPEPLDFQDMPPRTETGERLRGVFEVGAGRVLVGTDFNGLEMRLAALYSEEVDRER